MGTPNWKVEEDMSARILDVSIEFAAPWVPLGPATPLGVSKFGCRIGDDNNGLNGGNLNIDGIGDAANCARKVASLDASGVLEAFV